MRVVHLFTLAGLFLIELLLWREIVGRDTWFYPPGYDQVQYLGEAYRAYEHRMEHGFAAGMKEAWTTISAQGALHDVLAVPVLSLLGPGRESALTINFAAYIALQAATFFAAQKIFRSSALAWLAVALLVTLRCMWSREGGSMTDFRLDGMAACAYGVALAAAIAGHGFRSTRWAVAFGGGVALVVLTRFITAVYFVGIYGLLLVWLATQDDRWRRLGRLAISGAIATLVCGPVLWMHRQAIHDYYWIGHIEGPERVLRASHLNAWASVQWVLGELIHHLGGGLILLAGSIMGAGAIFRPHAPTEIAENPTPSLRDETWIALIFLAVPVAVLAVHELKAPHPVTIGAPAAVWVIALTCGQLLRRARAKAVATLAAVTASAAFALAAMIALKNPRTAEDETTAAKINALLDYFYYRAEESGLSQPRLAVTRISEALNAAPLSVLGYERHGRWLGFLSTLPTGLFETTRVNGFTQLGDSDFVCLVTDGSIEWPFDRQMAGWLPEMRSWCDAHLFHAADIEIAGFSVRLYERIALIRPNGGVELANFLADAEREPRRAKAIPPGPPRFPQTPVILGSSHAEISHRLAAAYDVRSFRMVGLPGGLRFDERTGIVSGRFEKTGEFTARITATNGRGTTENEIRFVSGEKTAFAVSAAPIRASAGSSIEIRFNAFDAAGQLSFVDVLDLTDGKLLERLPANANEGQNWRGVFRGTFMRAGAHTVALRFVRFDAKADQPYSSFDETRHIEVTAKP